MRTVTLEAREVDREGRGHWAARSLAQPKTVTLWVGGAGSQRRFLVFVNALATVSPSAALSPLTIGTGAVRRVARGSARAASAFERRQSSLFALPDAASEVPSFLAGGFKCAPKILE